MNINESPHDAAFRAEVRAWIAGRVPPHMKGQRQGIVGRAELTRAQLKPYEDALAEKGWLAPGLPQEHGGGGFDTMKMVIFNEEVTRAGVPFVHETALNNLLPIVIRYGTPEQKQRFIGPTIRREMLWCQGYSEPGAGSDLASLQLRAEQVEGGFALNGQKIWTSFAHESDWMFMLVRSDATVKRRQDGISFLLCDMKSPGIRVNTIVTIDDYFHFNEVFFEHVFVPRENLVGELNKGWTVAKALLGFERFNHHRANPIIVGRTIANLKAAARATPAAGGVVWDDPGLRRQVAQMEMDVACMRATRYRSLTRLSQGLPPGAEMLMLKLFGSELVQRIVDLHQQVLGPQGSTLGPEPFGEETGEIARYTANIRSGTIAGGTAEVQRNIIAKQVLALPDK
ncbi:MAG: acyl-CoA dehydrogenase family protein [Candidatus Lambdaproteobacteria bacterium]|nr:acyl-CoA dehydrogenase family protein [Candidatus Lambdaproteobacteria bacterium]